MNLQDYQNVRKISATSTLQSLPSNYQAAINFIDYEQMLRPLGQFGSDDTVGNDLYNLWRQDTGELEDHSQSPLVDQADLKIHKYELALEQSKVPSNTSVNFEPIQDQGQSTTAPPKRVQTHIINQYLEDKQAKKDSTAICKIIFTQFKKCLLNSCPIDMAPYFRNCPYKQNHRTLLDFQVPIWYVETLDARNPELGLLRKFREFAEEIKPLLLNHAQISYAKDKSNRKQKYLSYVERIYSAYLYGNNSFDRMKRLYGGANTPKANKKLQDICREFKF